MVKKIRHRGPDWSGSYSDERALILHERLSIVDVEHGAQPLIDRQNGNVLAVNGEIYNHKDLREQLKQPHDFQTASDCEVLLYLYAEEHPRQFLNRVNGIFAFVLYDPTGNTFLIARDPIGINPLYVGWDRHENLYVASEMKALAGVCERIQEFHQDTTTWVMKRKRDFRSTTSPNGLSQVFTPPTLTIQPACGLPWKPPFTVS